MGCACRKKAQRGIRGNTVGPRQIGTTPRQPSQTTQRTLALQVERQNSISAQELSQRANIQKLRQEAIQRKLGHN